jgi:hypothetical protein
VLEAHGCGDVGEKLSSMAAHKQWGEMAEQITDEMLEEFCGIAPVDSLAVVIKQRYGGILTASRFIRRSSGAGYGNGKR